MTAPRLAFIDWMKVLGMLLIVLGHTGADSLYSPTPPFNFKQLGVAFFVFVMGYSLAGDTRSPWRVFYNRMFEVFLFGFLFAVVLSIFAWLTIRDLAESNYLPLLMGINIVFNYFPANPTTWYIGTYFHLLLIWLLVLRHVQVRPWMILLSVCVEIPVRALLIESCGNHVAYMALTNWLTILLLGLWWGQRPVSTQQPPRSSARLLGSVAALAALLIVWPALVSRIGLERDFPFSRLNSSLPGLDWLLTRLNALLPSSDWLLTSAAVSFLYLTYTRLVFRLAQWLPASRVVEFLARNTLIVFIVHMPMIYFLCPHIYPLVPQGALRVLVNVALFFLLPACASELLRCTIHPTWWRDRLRERIVTWWTKAAPLPGVTR